MTTERSIARTFAFRSFCAAGIFLFSFCAQAQNKQKPDVGYTNLIKEYLQDPRVTTELVDHMPASDTVPSPLSFFGRIPGTPQELTYAKDIHRYFETLAANPRVPAIGPSAKLKKAEIRWCWPSPTKPP